jgi:hypothetical protein
VIFLALGGLSGCIASRMHAESGRSVQAGMEVLVNSAIDLHKMNTVGMFPFTSPAEMADDREKITTAFEEQLLRIRPFHGVRQLPYSVKADSEALWYGRSEGCDLVMIPQIVYLMDGTGAMPTELVIRTRILDVRSGMTLWDIKQRAVSEPGMDIDLAWASISGEPARRYQYLADHLARLFADFLAKDGKKNEECSSL